MSNQSSSSGWQFATYNSGKFYIQEAGVGPRMVVAPGTGNVGIGTTNPTERLQVVGNLKISGNILYGAPEEPVPDYVFEPDYKLMPIEELQRYMEKEKHLPNVPNAGEIKEKGLNLGEFQMKLLEKIEELALYSVQQAKAIDRKDAEIATLSARLAALEQMIDRLAKQDQK
jgi:hypothetical protein